MGKNMESAVASGMVEIRTLVSSPKAKDTDSESINGRMAAPIKAPGRMTSNMVEVYKNGQPALNILAIGSMT